MLAKVPSAGGKRADQDSAVEPPAPELAKPVGAPLIMHPRSMSKAELEKVRRVCTPKGTTGRLEVPKNIFDMWNTDKGRKQLLSMWCKSGGVKAGLCSAYSSSIKLP